MHLIRRMQKAAFPLAAGGFRCATIASGERFHSTNYSNSSQSVGLGILLTRTVVCSTVVGMTSMRRPRSVFTAPGVCSSSATASPYQWQMRSYTSGGEPDHYATLGVSPTSTPDEIKAAYKKMALEFHPDRNHAPDAEEKFKGISAAYQVIGNKTRRQEYDQQRRFSGGGGGGGAGPSGFPSGQSRGYPGGSYTSSTTQQQMSKEEADRLFRDIFGGMRVEDIFRNFEEELRRGSRGPNPGGLGGGFVGRSFGSREQVFRPFFSNTSSARIFTDAHGNRIEEHTFVDPRGRTYTSRRVSSTDPNASVNQTDEDYDSAHTRGSDGRVHFGRSSVNRKKPNMDFTQEMFNVRSHGRSPIMAFLILGAWTVVLCTMFYSMFHLLIYHPFFFLAILFLVMAGRRRPF